MSNEIIGELTQSGGTIIGEISGMAYQDVFLKTETYNRTEIDNKDSFKANDNVVVKTVNNVAPVAGNVTVAGGGATVNDGVTNTTNTWSSSKIDTAKADKVQGGWIAPTLLNGWLNYGGGYSTAEYMKDSLGFVHLKGTVKSGTVGISTYILPTGYLPASGSILIFLTHSNSATARVQLDDAGYLKALTGTNVMLSLDGITYKAER